MSRGPHPRASSLSAGAKGSGFPLFRRAGGSGSVGAVAEFLGETSMREAAARGGLRLERIAGTAAPAGIEEVLE